MKKNIYLVDLTHESKLGLGSDTMPLQLGLITAYCLKMHGEKVDFQIFKFINEFIEAVEKSPPFIIGASNYQWNIDLSYKLISLIKGKYPGIIAIFGGPNYPVGYEEQLDWLKKHPNVDFYVYKDGELPFSRLVAELLNSSDLNKVKKEKLPSVHALTDEGFYFGELEPRPKDLTVIPSPYTTGLMDKFFEFKLIPPIQTNRGCPFSCTYCTEGNSYYNDVCKTNFERKKAELDYIVKKVKHTKTMRISDSNFGMFPEDVEFCEYLGEVQKRTGYPEYLTCSAGKNQKERILKCNELIRGAMRVCASVQSLVPEVLKNVKRTNISLDDIMALSDQVSDSETHSYSEIILALPGDSLAGQKISMKGLMEAGISNITQHQLSIIYGAELSSKESRRKFGIKTMFRPIQRCIGRYSFGDKNFTSVEIEEIGVATNSMPMAEYFESRKLYLTVGLFYNDRIFGEINALLRLLQLSTWEWVELIHNNIDNLTPVIKNLYEQFMADTKNELREKEEDLVRDVNAEINKYMIGEIGGNLIYKYRSQAIAFYFSELHAIAYKYLHIYLENKDVPDQDLLKDLLEDINKFSRYQKENVYDTNFMAEETFKFDIVKMIKNPLLARNKKTIKEIHYPLRVKIKHSDEQKEMINRQLKFYGSDIGGLTMLLSRFPLKKFFRKIEEVQ
ncbi:hypothetical protein KKF32_00425 [Patescibacteria group bacterium]|nr:hypothetical protein [Patescibacteria group bacterium]